MSSQSFDAPTNKNGTDIDFNELNKYFSEYIDFKNDSMDEQFNEDYDDKYNHDQNTSNHHDICPNCGGDQFIEDISHGIVCINKSCGKILRAVMDTGSEWKKSGNTVDSRFSHVHNVLLPQSSLGTSIGGYYNNRVKILHTWAAMPYKERSLNNEFKKIHEICTTANILKCVEDDAKIMYKMISECKYQSGKNKGRYVITRGINRKSIIAGCLFFACLRKGVTRTAKEIANLWGITEMEMNRGCKNLLKLFKIKCSNTKQSINVGPSRPEHFIKRYCDELCIKKQYTDIALKIAINVEKLNIASNHTPLSSAAASILLMAELNNLTYITKKKLANEFNISDSTIQSTYKEIEMYKTILLNNDLTDKVVNQTNQELSKQQVPPEVLERMKKFSVKSTEPTAIIATTNITNTTNTPNTTNTMNTQISEEEISDLELDESDNSDEEYYAEEYYQELEDLSSNIHISMPEKYKQINNLLKLKSTDDICQDIEILKKSHSLIKEITKNLGEYAEHLSMFD